MTDDDWKDRENLLWLSCLILFDLGSCTGASSEPLQAITDGPRDAAAELALPGAPAQPALGDVGDRVDPW